MGTVICGVGVWVVWVVWVLWVLWVLWVVWVVRVVSCGSYRIYLARNHSRINPYDLPTSKVWRANMDIPMLYGNPFASIGYATYYTSKVDKGSNIKDVLNKMKNIYEDNEMKVLL